LNDTTLTPRLCVGCGDTIAPKARICKGCKTPQGDLQRCAVCAQWIPKRAKRCNGCGTYRDRRRFFPFSQTVLALLIALLSVLSTLLPVAINFLRRDSSTSYKLTASDEKNLYIKVWNQGRKPSILLNYRLRFVPLFPTKAAVPLLTTRPIQLHLDSATDTANVIEADASSKVSLTPDADLVVPKPGRNGVYKKDQIQRLLTRSVLAGQLLRLEIDVEESDDPSNGFWPFSGPRSFHTRSEIIPAARIYPFIIGRMSDDPQ
jgi:predicted nucleic acid-binding Zn ribbon protein